MQEEFGKVLIDISKLIIGGVILAGLMRQDIQPVLLLSIGGIVAASFIILGLILISRSKTKQNKKGRK